MRTKLVCRAAVGRVLMALVALSVRDRVVAQTPPSLAGALDSTSAGDWPDRAAAAPAVSPALADEYLQPMPSPEHGMLTEAPGSECSSCNGETAGVAGIRSYYNRCGCDTPLFPWIAGPGTCDNWCVGPHWNVEVDGMFIHREDAAWGEAGVDVVQQFEYGPGVRIFATGYNYSNYGLQIGYEGVNDFHSTAYLEGDVDLNPLTPLEITNDYTYESTLNSLEINVLRRSEVPLKIFAGFRYVEIDEEMLVTTLLGGGPLGGEVNDVEGTLVENRLMGVQAGAFRDAWQLNRWITIEPYGNAGAYFNDFKREDLTLDGPTGALLIEKNEFDEIAFLGEAGVTGILRINACLALRGGYQVMAFQNVGTALETSTLARGFDADELIYHGARFGVEYQR